VTYAVTYMLFFMVNVVGSAGALSNARKGYLIYVLWSLIDLSSSTWKVAAADAFSRSEYFYLGSRVFLLLFKTICAYLCSQMCFTLMQQQTSGSVPVRELIVETTAEGTTSVTQIVGERFNTADRCCSFNGVLFKPLQGVDWNALMESESRNLRPSYTSAHLVGMWVAWFGLSVAMLDSKYYGIWPAALDPLMERLTKLQLYGATTAAVYISAYIMYILVNVAAWMQFSILLHLASALTYVAVTLALAWLATAKYTLFTLPAFFFAITAASNALCASLVHKLNMQQPLSIQHSMV